MQRTILKIRTITSIPSFWLAIVILIFAILSICISKALYIRELTFESSVFSNIFAGLITGLVITILSGTKAVFVTYLQSRVIWLKQTHELILKHIHKWHSLFEATKLSDEEFFNIAYDAASYANHVNDRIMQSTFDKVKWFDPPKYCKKHYDYDCMEKARFFEELHDFLRYNNQENDWRKDVIEKTGDAESIMSLLDSSILSDITVLEVKIASAQKLFI
jgi:hypothetical protein